MNKGQIGREEIYLMETQLGMINQISTLQF